MKKTNITLSTIIAFFIATAMSAQIDVKGMIGMYTTLPGVSGLSDNIIDPSPVTRFTGGLAVDMPLDQNLTLSSGLFYRQKGFAVSEHMNVNVLGLNVPVGVKAVTEVNMIETPLMIKYKMDQIKGIIPFIAAGPGVSYAMDGQIKTKASAIIDVNVAEIPLELSSDAYNRFQLMGNVTGGVDIPYGNGLFSAELGYAHSFTPFLSDNNIVDANVRYNGLTFQVGYGMRF